MAARPEELSPEAREALRRENRIAFWRSMAIAMGFAFPSAIAFQKQSPILITWLCFGLPMGFAMPWLHIHLLDRLRHRSFVITLLRQSIAYMLTLAISLSTSLFLVLVWTFISNGESFLSAAEEWTKIVRHPYFLGALPFGVLLVLPVRFVFALNQKLGPGVLKKWMLGHYHEPREEARIFMFLDMKDSTTLAEQLGNLKFSALVRDFFQDLTLPVLQTKAEVSHYIGDEAVLTWTLPAGLASANCVRIFFEFEKSINRRAPYYREHYGLVPGFKAGLHFGEVVATEVGEIKSEIVFHGDVLNTAARIQGLCNGLGEGFLASSDLIAKIVVPDTLTAVELGAHELKGKEFAVGITAIRRKNASSDPG